MNELSEMIRDYIHECFNVQNRIPHSDEIYVKFLDHEPPDYIIEEQMNCFFAGYYITADTVVEYTGNLKPSVQIELEGTEKRTGSPQSSP